MLISCVDKGRSEASRIRKRIRSTRKRFEMLRENELKREEMKDMVTEIRAHGL